MATFDAHEPPTGVLFAAAENLSFLALDTPPTDPTDRIPPVVTMITPLVGLGKMVPVVFDVTDDSELGFHCIFVHYPNTAGLYEVAFDGNIDNVLGRGSYLVTRSSVTGGWRYSVLRRGGWPSKPTFVVRATDLGTGEI